MIFYEFPFIFTKFRWFSGGNPGISSKWWVFAWTLQKKWEPNSKIGFLQFLVTYEKSLFRGSTPHNFAPQEITRVFKNPLFQWKIMIFRLPTLVGPFSATIWSCELIFKLKLDESWTFYFFETKALIEKVPLEIAQRCLRLARGKFCFCIRFRSISQCFPAMAPLGL